MARRKRTTGIVWVLPVAAALAAAGLWWVRTASTVGPPIAASPARHADGVPPSVSSDHAAKSDRFRADVLAYPDMRARLRPAGLPTHEMPALSAIDAATAARLQTAPVLNREMSAAPAIDRATVALLRPAALDAVADLQAALPAAAAWLAEFDRTLRRASNDDEARPTQQALIDLEARFAAATAARPSDTMRLSNALASWAGPDPADRAAPYRLSLAAVARDLSARTQGDPGADEAVAVLSKLPERDWANAHDGKTLERLSRLRVTWLDPGTERHGWARTGVVEALYLQNRYADALAANDALLYVSELWPRQKSEVQWQRGLLLEALNRVQDALPFIRNAAADTAYHHAADASAELFWLELQLGNCESAEEQLMLYVHNWSPSQEQIDRMIMAVAEITWKKSKKI